MKEIGLMDQLMDMGKYLIQMDKATRGIFQMEREVDKECMPPKILHMMEIGKKAKWKVLEHSNGIILKEDTMGTSKTICSMERVHICIKMATNSKDFSLRVKNTEKEY